MLSLIASRLPAPLAVISRTGFSSTPSTSGDITSSAMASADPTRRLSNPNERKSLEMQQLDLEVWIASFVCLLVLIRRLGPNFSRIKTYPAGTTQERCFFDRPRHRGTHLTHKISSCNPRERAEATFQSQIIKTALQITTEITYARQRVIRTAAGQYDA